MNTSRSAPIVVVGTGPGGVAAARTLRTEGFTGPVVLLGAEAEPPYDRPPLSKDLLAGRVEADGIELLTPAEADAMDVELRLGVAATRLDPAGHRLELADGSVLAYAAVVLATGARAVPAPWDGAAGVHVLRSLADARALSGDLRRGGPLVVVGGGFVGTEVAATARGMGLPVTVVDPMPAPMARVAGAEVGGLFTELHRAHGVQMRWGVGVERIAQERSGLRMALTDGSAVQAATALVAIGAHPADEWLADSGLTLDGGVVCDSHGRTSTPDVHALGDLARWFHPGRHRHVRSEHWTNATAQGAHVARTLLHIEQPPHAPVDYVWTDQYDWRIQFLGYRAEYSRPEILGTTAPADASFVALFGDDAGRCSGAIVVNRPRAVGTLRRLLGREGTVTQARESVRARG